MAAVGPLGADLAGGPRRRMSSTGSILWPITVVGGSIAVAAFGVLGLYLMGSPSGEEVDAGAPGARPDAIGSTPPSAAATIGPDIGGSAWQPLDDGADPASAGIDGAEAPSSETARDGAAAAGADGAAGDRSGEAATPTTNDSNPTIGSEAREREPWSTATATEPVGPAIFTRAHLGSERLASLVAIDQHLITSASALKGHATVFLRVGGRWYRANVEQADMHSDVAVVGLYNDTMQLDLPAISTAAGPVENGIDAFVGYCDSEVAPPTPRRPTPDRDEPSARAIDEAAVGDGGNDTGDGGQIDGVEIRSGPAGLPPAAATEVLPDEPDPEIGSAWQADGTGRTKTDDHRQGEDGARSERSTVPVGPGDADGAPVEERGGADTETGTSKLDQTTTPEEDLETNPAATPGPEPGCGDGRIEPEPVGVVPPELGEPPVRQTPGPDHGPDDLQEHPDPRAGVVISTTLPTATLSDHIVYEPILTGIKRSIGMAGAPLRDEAGRVIGVILGSSNPLVAALPIERASEVAESLVTWGTGSQAWLGIEGRMTAIGLRVEAVDEDSPALDEIRPGDYLTTVDGERLQGTDHLTYLVREAGVGEELSLWFRRPGQGRQQIEVEVVTAPG